MEAQAAPVVGSVDVATLNHHGNRDSQSPVWVSTLKPTVWIEQVWSSDHPGQDVLNRITSQKLYAGKRDLYALTILEATVNYIGEETIEKKYQPEKGHIMVRVYDGGKHYKVMVLNDSSEDIRVRSVKTYESK